MYDFGGLIIIKGVSFQMQLQLLCPPNSNDAPYITKGVICVLVKTLMELIH